MAGTMPRRVGKIAWTRPGVVARRGSRCSRRRAFPECEIFLTTTVWVSNYSEKYFEASVDESLRKLKFDSMYCEIGAKYAPVSWHAQTIFAAVFRGRP